MHGDLPAHSDDTGGSSNLRRNGQMRGFFFQTGDLVHRSGGAHVGISSGQVLGDHLDGDPAVRLWESGVGHQTCGELGQIAGRNGVIFA